MHVSQLHMYARYAECILWYHVCSFACFSFQSICMAKPAKPCIWYCNNLSEVEMLKKCTPLWRKAHFQVKMYKTHHVRITFGRWDVKKVRAVVPRSTCRSQKCKKLRVRSTIGRSDVVLHGSRKGLCTLSKLSKMWRFCSNFNYNHHYTPIHYNYNYTTTLHYTTPRYTPLHYITLHYITLHSTTLRYITLHDATFHYTSLHCTTLHFTTTTTTTTQLHSTTLHYTKLHYITLHYIPLHSTTLHPLHYTTLHYTTLRWMTMIDR